MLATRLDQLKLESRGGQWPKKVLNAFRVVPSWTTWPGLNVLYPGVNLVFVLVLFLLDVHEDGRIYLPPSPTSQEPHAPDDARD